MRKYHGTVRFTYTSAAFDSTKLFKSLNVVLSGGSAQKKSQVLSMACDLLGP
jgi:hypothetical protein